MDDSSQKQLDFVHLLIALTICAVWFYFSRRLNLFGDDLAYGKCTVGTEFLLSHYQGWSSRLFIETVLISALSAKWILQVLTFFVLLSTPIGIYLLTKRFGIGFGQCVVLAGILPLWTMNSAGWGATLINYWYPSTAALFGLFLVLHKERLSFFGGVAMVVLLLFAANQELVAVTLLGIIGLLLLYGERSPKILIALVLTLLSILFEVTTPGNHARLVSEIKTWLPAFVDYTFLYKTYIGTMRVVRFHLFDMNACFVLLAAGLVYFKCQSTEKTLFAVIVFFALQLVLKGPFGGMNCIAPFNGPIGWKPVVALLIAVVEYGFLIWCVFSASAARKIKFFVFFACMLSFAVPALMGFSPTIWASADRTFLPGEFMLVTLGAALFGFSGIDRNDFWKVLYLCLLVAGPRLVRLVITMA